MLCIVGELYITHSCLSSGLIIPGWCWIYWNCTLPGKWRVFLHTPELCLTDGVMVLWWLEVSQLPQDIHRLTPSCHHNIYVAGPFDFLVNGNPKDFNDGDSVKVMPLNMKDRWLDSGIKDGHCPTFLWHECNLPHFSHVWKLCMPCCIQTWVVSFTGDLQVELNLVQS